MENLMRRWKMPIVHVHFWEGVSEEKVKTMIRGITNVMVDLGVRNMLLRYSFMKFPRRTGA